MQITVLLLLLVAAVVELVNTGSLPVGISKSGFYPGRSGTKSVPENNGIVSPVGDGLSWWVILLITLFIVVCIFFVVKCCVELQDLEFGSGRKICYLCMEKVRGVEWKSGSHRRQCAFRNADTLNNMFQHAKAICPKCKYNLRLWPEGGNQGFTCDSEGTIRASNCISNGKKVQSNGKNRYNCFLCDFDLCEPCVQLQVEINDKSECLSVISHTTGASQGLTSRKSSYDQQGILDGRRVSKDGILHIPTSNDQLRRQSKDSLGVNGAQKRFALDTLNKEERRASHAGFSKPRSHPRRPSDEQLILCNQTKMARRTSNTVCPPCKTHSRRDLTGQKYDPSRRRKSHADILTSTNLHRPPDLFIPTSGSRRYSQVEVRDVKTFQSRALYTNKELNDLVKSPHCSQEQLHTSQSQLSSCSRRHSREQLTASQKRLSYSRGSRERLLANSREKGEEDKEDWEEEEEEESGSNSPVCEPEGDDTDSVINIQSNCLSEIQDAEPSFLCPEHQNLQIAERLAGHTDDVSNSESEQACELDSLLERNTLREDILKNGSGFRDNHAVNGKKLFIQKNGKSRRASLMPVQTEPIVNPLNKKRRNSSTVLIIKGENSGSSPIFINKEDGLPRFDVHC